jgi:hypothetical protein
MLTGMDPYRGADVTITVVEASDPSRFSLSWSGRGTERDPATTLTPFLRSIVERAGESQVAVELQCQALTYINAVTIGCIVDMIRRSASASVPLILRYDQASRWQRMSFETLRVLCKAGGGLTVEGV